MFLLAPIRSHRKLPVESVVSRVFASSNKIADDFSIHQRKSFKNCRRPSQIPRVQIGNRFFLDLFKVFIFTTSQLAGINFENNSTFMDF